jgi:hypothetical protein
MSLVICNAGEITLLTIMLQTALAVNQTFTLHLYQNSGHTFTSSSSVNDLTECNFDGYSAFSLSRASWTTPTIVSGSAQSQYASGLTWACTGAGNTVYGAYVLDPGGNLIWGEDFSTPRVVSNGDTLTYTPVFTLTSD